MKNEDVAIIQRILADDETAFAELVKKYQKAVHTLAWRKIGDFHIAEDITQDAFLKVYQKLDTLQDPNQFAGWLYVITTNLCSTWLRKKRIQTKRLEEAETTMAQRDAYSEHVTGDSTKTAVETQREVVKKLLAKLKESERTVMSLHYLGEMKIEEISRFLGVSTSTIKSRLRRARNRLQKEETMIREALDHFKLSPNITDNIMQEISRLKPTPSTIKPLVPWAVAATSAILLVFMLSIGSQQLLRFQQPYSLDAQAEMTVELVDAPIVLNVDVKPDVRNQLGTSNALGISENEGQKPDEVLLAAAESEGEDVSVPKQQWIQSEPIKGSPVHSLRVTTEGDLYVLIRNPRNANIHKLTSDGNTWQSFEGNPPETAWSFNGPMLKWNDTFYTILYNELLATKDEGKTWNLLYSWQEANGATEFVQIEQALYIAFEDGIFKSEDSGKTWKSIHDEKIKHIESLFKIQDTLFVRTYRELYRLEDDKWKRIEFPAPVRRIISIAGSEDKLYVVIFFNWEEANVDRKKMEQGLVRGWWIYRSTDHGNSWTDITPTNAWNIKGWPPNPKMVATGDTLLVMERGMVRSTDGGDTWMPPQQPDTSPLMSSEDHAIALDENTFYISNRDGLHRSIDGGKSWEMVKIPQDKTRRVVWNLIKYIGTRKRQNEQHTLYGIVSVGKIAKTTDNGKSWKDVQVDFPMSKQLTEPLPTFIQIKQSENGVYAKGGSIGGGKIRHYKVSKNGYTLEPIQDMPTFDSFELRMHLYQTQDLSIEVLQEHFTGATQFFKQMLQLTPQERGKLEKLGLFGPFAVSDDTFYSEYNFKLFRWEPGYTEWYDTGQEEVAELSLKTGIYRANAIIPKLAALGDTVYYGKRDGHLVVSFDKGNNWVDITPGLPFKVKTFYDIVFAGSTVYVATDTGIITSDDGRTWKTVNDSGRSNIIMAHLAVDGTILYGVTKDIGIYRLENDTWSQIVSEIPDNITSLAVDGNTIYVGTQDNGMLYFNLNNK